MFKIDPVMWPFLETVVHLDAVGDFSGLIDFVANSVPDPKKVCDAILLFLTRKRLRSAFILAKLLAENGYRDAIIAIARSIGGLVYNLPEENAQGLMDLRVAIAALSVEQQTLFYKQIVIPVLLFHVFKPHIQGMVTYADEQILQILAIFKAAVPHLRTVFDWDATVPTWSLETLRQQGWAQSRLLTYALPPIGLPRYSRRVVVAMAERHPLGRMDDMGVRITAAMQAYGWQALFHGLHGVDVNTDCRDLLAFCRQQDAEQLVLNLDAVIYTQYGTPGNLVYHELIAQLRLEKPAFKVVGFLFDTWSFDPSFLVAAAEPFDIIWEITSPHFPVWDDPVFANKVLHTMQPMAGYCGRPDKPLTARMLFSGSVRVYNCFRAFWLSAARHLHLPVHSKVSTHYEDGLSALESYALYVRGLAKATCCLNIAMRSNQTCIATGRSFEAMLMGALLVEEWSPAMPYYFVAGEHYLAFSSLAELSAAARFITENREAAEDIRRRGNAFARERYSDEKLIGYLDKLLYFS